MNVCMACGRDLSHDGSCSFCESLTSGEYIPVTPVVERGIVMSALARKNVGHILDNIDDFIDKDCSLNRQFVNCAHVDCAQCQVLTALILMTGVELPEEIRNDREEFAESIQYIRKEIGM